MEPTQPDIKGVEMSQVTDQRMSRSLFIKILAVLQLLRFVGSPIFALIFSRKFDFTPTFLSIFDLFVVGASLIILFDKNDKHYKIAKIILIVWFALFLLTSIWLFILLYLFLFHPNLNL